jgi:F-type H+-transporting ATPase subunit a
MNNPLSSFAVEKLIGIDAPVVGASLYLTNNSFYLILGILLTIFLFNQNNVLLGKSVLPNNIGIVGEAFYSSLLNMARNTSNNQVMLPLLMALFTIILSTNLLSNIPYNYASTSALTFTLGLSLTVFIGITTLAISIKGWSYLATFVPANTPNVILPLLVLIELVSYCARAVSLGIRLFANIVAGHTLLNIISSMSNKIMFSGLLGLFLVAIPILLLIILVGLEIAVAFIQAYVFVVLTAIYLDEAIRPLA